MSAQTLILCSQLCLSLNTQSLRPALNSSAVRRRYRGEHWIFSASVIVLSFIMLLITMLQSLYTERETGFST